MALEMELEKARNEVLRKIGRNMLLFQYVEHRLKFFITHGNISGHLSEIEAIQSQRAATVHKQTMGQLVGQFLENPTLIVKRARKGQQN